MGAALVGGGVACAALWAGVSTASPAACAGKSATQLRSPKSEEANTKFDHDQFAIFSGRSNPAVSEQCTAQQQ